MDFSELIQKRYSVRAYRGTPVEKEKLRAVLEAARLAPTAANRQPVHLYVLPTAGHPELKEVYPARWLMDAGCVVAAAVDRKRAWNRSDGQNYAELDAGIVMDHLILAATEQGLGSCWIGAFNPQAARRVFRIPDGCDPMVLAALGYAADSEPKKLRRPLDELVTIL